MKKFELIIGELQFDDAECQYRELYIHFVDLWNSKLEHLLVKIEDAIEVRNLSKINEVAKTTVNECVSEGVINILLQAKIFSYDLGTIQYDYNLYRNWEKVYEKLKNRFDEINLQNQKEQAYRDYRKASRGKWVGGGFGVKGALKGAATAAVLNGITGTAHSIGNAVGNAYSNYKADQKLQKLFGQNNLAVELCAAIGEDVKNLVDILVDILKSTGMNIKKYTTEEKNVGIGIYNNYHKIDNYEDRKEALKQCIKSNPYDSDFGILYLEDFYTGYESDKEFDELCSYFGMDIESMKSQVLFSRFREYFDLSDSEKIRCLEEYLKTAKMWRISNTTKKEVEYCFIWIEDIKLDIDHVKCVSEELRKKVTSEQYFKPDIYISAKFFQRILSECTYSLVNGETVKCDNAEEAINLLRAKLEIINIYESCNMGRKGDIVAAIEKINECNAKYNNKKIGYKVLNYMKYGAAVIGVVFDPTIENENFELDIGSFKGGKFVSAPVLTLMENGEIQYPDNYSNRIYEIRDNDEKDYCEKTIEAFRMEYEKMDFRDEDALLRFKDEVQKFKNQTGLGNNLISEAEERLEYIDKCERTVLGIEYSTREEAAKEKKKVVGKHKYETEEQAGEALKEEQIVQKFIEINKNQKSLYQYMCDFQLLEKHNIHTLSGKDKIAEIEKNIISRYQVLCDNINRYKKAKQTIGLWILFAIIGTILGVIIFIFAGLIIKFLCICVVLWLWMAVNDRKKIIQNFDQDTFNEKQRIDQIAVIDKNKILFKNEAR